MINLHNNFELNELNIINFIHLSYEEKKMVLNWRNHSNIRRWMYSDDIISEEEHIKFIDKLATDDARFYWIVKKRNECLGTVSFNKIDFKNKYAYLGIYSNPYSTFKNKGSMLIKCIKTLAFEIVELHTLKLEVLDSNQKAINFYKKEKFIEEGKLKECILKNNEWNDVIVMGVINNI